MFLIPYERLTIKTLLRSEDILQKLENVVEPRRYFRIRLSENKPYQGTIEEFHFSISRMIHYRNSFLPMIKGDIRSEFGGSSINITMSPHILVIIFMIFWFGVVGFGFLTYIGEFISTHIQAGGSQSFPAEGLLGTAAMLILGYGLFMGGFKFESIKSKTFFRQLFEESKELESSETDVFGAG